MRRRALTIALACAASLFSATAAHADVYLVNGLDDSVDPPQCEPTLPGMYACSTLRGAVYGAGPEDSIQLQVPGEYALTAGPLELYHDAVILGLGPAQTTIRGGSDFRTMLVSEQANVGLTNLTLAGGTAPESGGNLYIDYGSQAVLSVVRVTGGSAQAGGGVASYGDLVATASLFDGNTASVQGGAIASYAEDPDASVTLINSTVAGNTAASGSALFVVGSAVQLFHSTIARNSGDAIAFSDMSTTAGAYGSLIGPNSGANCVGGAFTESTASIESADSCGLNLPNTDVGLASALSNPGGGPTSVLTIPANSPAVDFVNPCLFESSDQQLKSRSTGACDAGAYEVQAANTQPPPDPTPVPPPPTPTPTPTPEPTPVAGRSVGAETTRGRVLVKLPGSRRFVALDDGVIPNGTEVDARRGTVEISRSDGGAAKFSEGRFKISQSRRLTTLTLTEKLSCPKRKRARIAVKKAKRVKKRKLFGNGKGRFRTKGQYGAATVRGTKWRVSETCTSTTVRVQQGAVTFRDLVKRKNIVVRRNKSATARARRR